MTSRPLTRSKTNRIFGGVAGGIAAYTGLDSGIVRIITAVVVLVTGVGPILYILAWILLPEEGSSTTGLDSIIASFKSRSGNDNPNPTDLR
ncbi:MAG: PspC domain-containing protein [Propionibacteriaceae bacterium]|nr:PspC domain-containing protein [Propionibacteriaceae bacterium]